jgi:calcineurin-like phosphoesterase family protein
MAKDSLIRSTVLVVLLAITIAVGTGDGLAASIRAQSGTPNPLEADPVLVAVGDIASCTSDGDEATAALLDGLPGTIATLGDHAYRNGTPREFAECYDPSWGRHRDRTRPAPGNHDYETSGAAGYFEYFGAAAGEPGKGYYSYDLGTWHIVALNSNCSQVGGCGEGTPQEQWLREDLAAHPATCTLAYWHHPLFSSGKEHGGDEAMRPAWQALYDAGADVVLSAHEHHYERFAPQDPDGRLDRKRGIRQFVVGTGGRSHYGFGRILETSEARNAETFGVLVLTLRPASYDWVFVPVGSRLDRNDERSFPDSGSADCH